MDVRNITEVPETIPPSEYLDYMFTLSDEQFKGYQMIEDLPDYPMDINNPKNQVVLKDFLSRVVEELTEGFESTEAAYKIMDSHGWNTDTMNVEVYQDMLNHLQNANEEQADAIGFWIPLFRYSNITPEDIFNWYKTRNPNYKLIQEGLDIDFLMLGGLMVLSEDFITELDIVEDDKRKRFKLIDSEDYWGNEVDLDEYDRIKSYTPGFCDMSISSHSLEKVILFDIIYQLNIARNLLKSRSWKQTQVMTKELEYQSALVKAFYMYMGFLGMYGFTVESLKNLFFKKQRLNLWRQKTGY